MSDLKLKEVLTSLGFKVYALTRPADSPLPALVYRRVGETDYMTHKGATSLSRNRFTIIHVARDYAELRALVSAVKSKLLGNNVDFDASVPTDIHIESREADNIVVAHKDYLIFFK